MKLGSVVSVAMLWVVISGPVFGETRYVAQGSPSPASPFTNWLTAAHEIQQALDVSVDYDEILVSNGVYNAGGAPIPWGYTSTNRICVTNAVRVQSVNGPDVTIIEGQMDPYTGESGSNAVRCAYLRYGSTLAGFTLRGGATVYDPYDVYAVCGGGILCDGATVSNCIIEGNHSWYGGGGIWYQNAASVVERCVIRGNRSPVGAGVSMSAGGGILRNCFVQGNVGADNGGGIRVVGGTVDSCTVAGNEAYSGGGIFQANSFPGVEIVNTIVYDNRASISNNHYLDTNVFATFTCSTPLPTGPGNIDADPRFAGAGFYHLRGGSPCVDAGTNEAWMTGSVDFDGEPRIRGADADIGADEAWAFEALSVTGSPSRVVMVWDTAVDGSFRLQAQSNLLDSTWLSVGNVVTSSNARLTTTNANLAPQARAYRLQYQGP